MITHLAVLPQLYAQPAPASLAAAGHHRCCYSLLLLLQVLVALPVAPQH
jgi:hypothetical protein